MKERIEQKIHRVNQYLQNVRNLAPDCQAKFDSDFVYRGALLHYLYLMADSCISLAEMVIRDRALRPPQTYYESFDILAEASILDQNFAKSFSGIAGFRNFLAHDYEVVEAKVICNEILKRLDEVEEFINQIN
ncbi:MULTISPECIES: type VII toxin-antitoxin system HepT family RNase toxin [Desulfosediminicola]|uniref:type VII toxin-antitoxin system HepT family RNase toxin n=1 Tax=Desulfosediminicola TaxID=2886823 RepID=UPI0010AB81EC|nr:DUF86 domain-containing protein [Desulfosediminicola ganghwensis]